MIEGYKNKIINADCLDILKELPPKSIDLVLTDPPYRNSEDNQPTKDMRNNGTMDNFGDKPTKEYFEEMFRVSKNQIIWGANNFTLPNYKGFLVWRKKTISQNFTMSMCEIAFISEGLGTVSKLYEIQPQDINRVHPTQKPVKLFEWCLKNYSEEGQIIFDPFSGSGTTAIACHNLKRNFICIESDKEYWAKSVERYEKHKLQGRLEFKQ